MRNWIKFGRVWKEAVVPESKWSQKFSGLLRKPVEIAVNLAGVRAEFRDPNFRIQVRCYNNLLLGPIQKPKDVKCNIIFCFVYLLNLVNHQLRVLDNILMKRIFASCMQQMLSSSALP